MSKSKQRCKSMISRAAMATNQTLLKISGRSGLSSTDPQEIGTGTGGLQGVPRGPVSGSGRTFSFGCRQDAVIEFEAIGQRAAGVEAETSVTTNLSRLASN